MVKKLSIGLLIGLAAAGLALVSHSFITANFGGDSPDHQAIAEGRGSFWAAEKAAKGEERAPELGYRAPAFTLTGADGERTSLGELSQGGKPIMLNFWASSCAPCIQEIPHLQAFYERYQDQVQIVGINWAEDPAQVRSFLQDKGVTYPNLLDRQGKAFVAYRLTGTPTSYFIDQNRVVRGVWLGPMTFESLEASFDRISTAFDPRGSSQ
ncbi:MAG: TlpA family protein disulfide reductase [Candidatus Bipolaricaulia bacterium]